MSDWSCIERVWSARICQVEAVTRAIPSAFDRNSRLAVIVVFSDRIFLLLLLKQCRRSGLPSDPAKKVSRPFGQIWALPPSTNRSIPVTKLESSEARNNATLATSSGSPMRPIGMVDTIRAITSADCRLARDVLIGPGLTTFERMRRSFRSVVQVRTKERMAALLAA